MEEISARKASAVKAASKGNNKAQIGVVPNNDLDRLSTMLSQYDWTWTSSNLARKPKKPVPVAHKTRAEKVESLHKVIEKSRRRTVNKEIQTSNVFSQNSASSRAPLFRRSSLIKAVQRSLAQGLTDRTDGLGEPNIFDSIQQDLDIFGFSAIELDISPLNRPWRFENGGEQSDNFTPSFIRPEAEIRYSDICNRSRVGDGESGENSPNKTLTQNDASPAISTASFNRLTRSNFRKQYVKKNPGLVDEDVSAPSRTKQKNVQEANVKLPIVDTSNIETSKDEEADINPPEPPRGNSNKNKSLDTVVQQPYPRTRSKTRIVASSNKGPMLNDSLQATQLQSKNKRHTKTKNKSLEEHVSLPATEDQSIRLKASRRLRNRQAKLNSQQEEHAVSSESANVDLSNVADVSTKRPMLSDSLKATLNNASLPLQSKNKRLTKKKNESLEEQDQSIRLKASQRRENKQARPNSQQEEHAVSSESANIDLSSVANVSTKRKCTFEDREDEGFSKSGKLKTRRMKSKEKMKESNDRLESYDSPPSEEILGDKLDVSVQSTSNDLTKRNSSKGKRLTNSRNKQSTKKQKDSLEQVSLPAVEDQNIKLKTRRVRFNSRQDEHPSEERLGAAGTSAVPSQSKRKLRNNSRKKLREVENSIVDEKENEHLGTSIQPSDTETSHIHLETANRSRSKKSTRRPRNITSHLREVTVSNILQNEDGVRPQRKRKVAPRLITLEEMAAILSRPARLPKGEPLMKRRKTRQTRENSRTSKKRNVQRSAVRVPKPRIEGIFEEEEMAHNNSVGSSAKPTQEDPLDDDNEDGQSKEQEQSEEESVKEEPVKEKPKRAPPETPAKKEVVPQTPKKVVKEKPPQTPKAKIEAKPSEKPKVPLKEASPTKAGASETNGEQKDKDQSEKMETETRGEKRKRDDDDEETEETGTKEKKRKEDSSPAKKSPAKTAKSPAKTSVLKEKVPPKEDEPEFDPQKPLLSWLDSDLHLKIDSKTLLSAKPLNEGCLGYVWAGARATHGASSGKVCFELKITEELKWDDPADKMQEKTDKVLKDRYKIGRRKAQNKPEKTAEEKEKEERAKLPPIPGHYFRVGFSLLGTSLQLGETKYSYAYESTGKFVTNKEFQDYGVKFGVGDVVGAFLSIDNNNVSITYTVNGALQPTAITVPRLEFPQENFSLFPHVLCRNYAYELNFGDKEGPWFPRPDELKDYQFLQAVEGKVAGPRRAEKREECEVLLMVGLPCSGKTHWVKNHLESTTDKAYTVIGNHPLFDRMTVGGEPMKPHFRGSWKFFVDSMQICLNQLTDLAALRRRNYIIDQTNVYPNSRRRKLRAFEGFKRKAVVVVCEDDEHQRRQKDQQSDYGKTVPEGTLYDLKAQMELPQICEWIEELVFTDLNEEEAKKKVKSYNEEANKKGYFKRWQTPHAGDKRGQRPFRGARRGGGFGRGRFERYPQGSGWNRPAPAWGSDRRDMRGPPGQQRSGWRQPPRDQNRSRGDSRSDSSFGGGRNQGGGRNVNVWQGSGRGGSDGSGNWGAGNTRGGWYASIYGSYGYGAWNQGGTDHYCNHCSYSSGQGQREYGSNQGGYGTNHGDKISIHSACFLDLY